MVAGEILKNVHCCLARVAVWFDTALLRRHEQNDHRNALIYH